MGIVYKMSRIVTVLVLTGWLAASAAAFTPGEFSVSPQAIDIGTIRLLPGAESGTFSFSIAVVGGPVPDVPDEAENEEDAETPSFFAATDAPWITISSAEDEALQAPGSITAEVLVSETMGEGRWEGSITIISGLDPDTDPVSIPVTMTVIRSIGDLLTVSPTSLDLVVTEKNAGSQTFPIDIGNADPDRPDFDWSASTDTPWLALSRYSGTGNATISLTVNPQLLSMNEDLDGDGLPDIATGTVTFLSNLNAEQNTENTVVLTVSAKIAPSYDLSVHPGQLFWSIEKGLDTASLTLDPQYLQVFAGEAGWTVTSDVHFLQTLAVDLVTTDITDETGAVIDTQVSTHPYGRVEVTPIAGLLQAMDYGNYTGTITISDRFSRFFRKIPVTINIRRPGDPVTLPVPAPETYQISPYYSMIETPAARQLHLQLPVPDNLAYQPTEMMCEDAGGQWLDPDNVPGNLNEYCNLNQYVYVLMEFPQMAPGLVYAWDKFGRFFLAYNNGIKTSGADDHTYADGPVPVIPIGPIQLLEYHGSMVISTRVGADLSSAVETQRIQINLRTLEGTWKVSEYYNGMLYSYDSANLLKLDRKPAEPGYYAGTWGNTPVNVVPGDGTNWLHDMSFVQNGLTFTYRIQALSAGQITGVWRFAWPGGASRWQSFQAQRQLLLPW